MADQMDAYWVEQMGEHTADMKVILMVGWMAIMLVAWTEPYLVFLMVVSMDEHLVVWTVDSFAV